LGKKKNILCELLKKYNDGRMKNYYCIAVNLIPLVELEEIMKAIKDQKNDKSIEKKEKVKDIKKLFDEMANNLKLEIRLRK
jgi:fructose-bisphosphate aldolase class 1